MGTLLVAAAALPAERTPILRRVLLFQSHLLLSPHMHLYFLIPACVEGRRCYYSSVYFVIGDVCLFLYRQACRYLLIYVIYFVLLYGFIFRSALFEAISLFF